MIGDNIFESFREGKEKDEKAGLVWYWKLPLCSRIRRVGSPSIAVRRYLGYIVVCDTTSSSDSTERRKAPSAG